MSDVVLLPFPLTWLWGSGKDAPSSASLAVDDKAVPARDKIQSASDTRKFQRAVQLDRQTPLHNWTAKQLITSPRFHRRFLLT